MKKISEQEYENLVSSKASFLVQFGASWCVPCTNMTRILESMEADYNIDFMYMDVDDCPNVSDSFGVRSVPTLVLLVNGNLVDMLVGVQRKDQIDHCLKKYVRG